MAEAPGKWQVIPAAGPTVEAVRGTLETFLDEACRRFRQAGRKGLENSEHAHQARVWSRRATAALALYRDWLPNKAYRNVRDGLRDLRRAADGARTWDVWLDWLRDHAGIPGMEAWMEQAEIRQRKAYRALARARRADTSLATLGETSRKVLERIACRHLDGGSGDAAVEAVRGSVRARMDTFFGAMPVGSSGMGDFHRFRIAGKKLRYTLELTHSLFDPALRQELYPRLTALLDRLGELNDLAGFLKRVSHSKWCGTEAGRRLQDELLIRQQQALGKYWEVGHPELVHALQVRFQAVCCPSG